MIGPLAARWLLTAVFAAAGLAAAQPRRGLAGPAGQAQPTDWPSAVLCPVMCLALIGMTWWSEPSAAAWLQAAVFSCAALWFATAGVVRTRHSRRAGMAGLHNGLMAGSMIWMLAAMPAASAMPQASSGRSAMPGMSHAVMSEPVVAISVLLAAYFGLAAVPWLMRAIGPGRRVSNLASAGQAAMSAGMAVMMIVML